MAKNKVVFGNEVIIDLTAANLGGGDGDKILAGYSAFGNDGEMISGRSTFDADTSDADATAAEILSGQTAYVNGSKVTGTMPNNGGTGGTISDASQPFIIPAGYTDGSAQVGISDTELAKLLPENIKEGIVLLGTTGSYTGEGVTAQAKTATPYTTQQTILPDSGYDYLSQVTINPITYTETANQYGTTVTIGAVAPTP